MAGVKGRSGAPGRRRNWESGLVRPDIIDELRSRIKTGAILQCLQEHALGHRKMGDTQIKAAAILLRKVIPDLASVDITANGGGPLVIEIVKFAPDALAGPTIIEHEPADVPELPDAVH